jgi:hypothetical protein
MRASTSPACTAALSSAVTSRSGPEPAAATGTLSSGVNVPMAATALTTDPSATGATR